MTKIKNTKKGMAKKTLSMSLVVAMLATSNVPVWAADMFSDGNDVSVESTTPEVEEVTAAFSDDAAATESEAPVVEDNTEDAVVATASGSYDFTGVAVNSKVMNPTWDEKADTNADKVAFTATNLFESNKSTFTVGTGSFASGDLRFVWAYDDSFTESGINPVLNADLKTGINEVPTTADLKANVGKELSLVILEKSSTTRVVTYNFGKIQKVNIATIGATVSLTGVTSGKLPYSGTDQKPATSVSGVTDSIYADVSKFNNADNYTWAYAGTNGLKDVNSVVTVTGTYVGTDAECYTGTLTAKYTISKLDFDETVAKNKILIVAKNPEKKFQYPGAGTGATLEVDKSEVDVYLADADGKSTGISLNDYVKTVTVKTAALETPTVFTVKFDAAKINTSATFKVTSKADFEKDAETTYEGNKNTVTIEKLDLSNVIATLKNPIAVGASTAGLNTVDKFTFTTKDGKTLKLTGADITINFAQSSYNTAGTYKDITITANDTTKVKGSTTADVVVKKAVFNFDNAVFKGGNGYASDYLTNSKADVSGKTKYLTYNNGNAVEFKAEDLFNNGSDAKLGWFDPTGDNSTVVNQSHFKVKYKNNVNATPLTTDSNTADEKLAVLTVYAVGGDYDGCSKDFYFKIAPAEVAPTSDDSTTTVTTKATKDVPGIVVNDSFNDAEEYADAIGLKVTGTNGETGSKKVVSNASSDDYKVDYSYVNTIGSYASQDTNGTNEPGNYVKVEVTLKKDGNFKTKADEITKTALGKDTGVIYRVNAPATSGPATAQNNGKITLYVPILDKAIEGLDVSLDETNYTFTGETIKPKVSVKLNGKAFVEGEDYTVKVNNGINVGTAEVVVTMKKESGYQGSKKLSATITPAKLSDVKFVIKEGKEQVYDRTQKKPLIAQADDPATTKNEYRADTDADAQVKLGSVMISQLFDITYGANINAGKEAGTVTLTPKASAAKNFDGSSVTATFEIERRKLEGTSKDDDKWAVKLTNDDGLIVDKDKIPTMEWTGKEIVFDNTSVIADRIQQTANQNGKNVTSRDFTYKLAYANNVDSTNGQTDAYVCVVGTGNYGGKYSIVKAQNGTVSCMETADVEKANKKNPETYEVLLDNVLDKTYGTFDIAGAKPFKAKNVTITNATYAGGVAVKPGSVVKDPKTGAVLTEGKDYKLVFDAKKVDATTTPIEVTVEGLGQYKGSSVSTKTDGSKLTFVIEKKDLKDCSVSVDKDLKLTVMNGNVLETKENFTVKDNGDGTATVSVVDGGKNYTGSVKVEIGGRKVGAPMISNVKVVGNKATVILSDDVEGASGYDYVISTDKDCITNKDYAAVNKNQAKTTTAFKYVDKGTYYAYCHAWTRDANGKKVFGEWSNGFQFSVTATTPDAPVITDVKVSGSTIKVTYRPAANATGYDVVLGTSSKKDNGELRPYNYGAHKKLNLKEGTVTATFKNVPKGTWTVGMHAFNRTSIDNKKVFSPWSNLETAKVK